MNKFFQKRGEVSFELILIVTFIVFLLVAIWFTVRFYNSRENIANDNENIAIVYNNILTRIRLDSHKTVVVGIGSGTADFFDVDGNVFCRYENKDGALVRIDKDKSNEVLLDRVEAVAFSYSQELPNLLTVRIFPADKKAIPFFTSFALRGLNNDLQ